MPGRKDYTVNGLIIHFPSFMPLKSVCDSAKSWKNLINFDEVQSALNEIYTSVNASDYQEGYVKVMGYWLFFKSFGKPKSGTLLCLHGGPGGSHDNLISLAKFSSQGFRVVFYDQLGCGKSQHPQNQALYTVERYVEEVEGVRRTLNLTKVHLYGNSWGGSLNTAYAVKYSRNLLSLLISSGTPSTPLCVSEMWRLRTKLPNEIRQTLEKYEDENDLTNIEYLRAMYQVYRRHLCRLSPWPPMMLSIVDQKRIGLPSVVYRLMWGQNEFFPTGNLRYWDVTDELQQIKVPTLITCGRYDEITPKNALVLKKGIPDSKLVIFENSSHSARIEEPKRHDEVYGDFLKSVS